MTVSNIEYPILLGVCEECRCPMYEVDGKLKTTSDLPDHICSLEREEEIE